MEQRRENTQNGFLRLERELKRGPLKPFYLLWGQDRYLLRRAEGLILDKVLPPSERELNLRVFSEGIEVGDILNELKTLPFFAKGKVVILREASGILRDSGQLLLRYLQAPNPHAVLIAETEEQPPQDFQPWCYPLNLTPRDILYWINRLAREKGLSLSREAAHLLKDLGGGDLWAISLEVEKIALYKGQGWISLKDLEEILGDLRLRTAFDLIDAIERGNPKEALLIAERLWRQGEPSPKVLGAIAWRLRERLKEGPKERLLRILKGLYSIDHRAKRSGTASRFLIEELILELLH